SDMMSERNRCTVASQGTWLVGSLWSATPAAALGAGLLTSPGLRARRPGALQLLVDGRKGLMEVRPDRAAARRRSCLWRAVSPRRQGRAKEGEDRSDRLLRQARRDRRA